MTIAIFQAVFECTLEMINKNFEEFPEHRTNFYILLQQVVQYNFKTLLEIDPAQFRLVLDSIIWAFKHTMRNVADTGLQILLTFLESMGREDQVIVNSFYQTYYTDILQHMFSVVTDTSHTAGLRIQACILSYMFSIIESGRITAPLNPTVQTSGQTNVQYVQEYVSNLLKSAFSHLTDSQIKITVQGFFNLDQDVVAFKEHLRDFLVQIRVSFCLLFEFVYCNQHYSTLLFRNSPVKTTAIYLSRSVKWSYAPKKKKSCATVWPFRVS